MNKKGHVLVHVLITTVIVCVIATGLAQMVLMRYTANQRLAGGTAGRKQDEGAFNVVLNVWNAQNRVCYNGAELSAAGFSCSGGGCGTSAFTSAQWSADCACTVQPSPACSCPAAGSSNPGACPGTMTATWDAVNSRCQLSIASCQ